MQWISVNDDDYQAQELANILSAYCKVGAHSNVAAPCSDGHVCSIWSEKIEDLFLHMINDFTLTITP